MVHILLYFSWTKQILLIPKAALYVFNLSISNSIQLYDKRDGFDCDIVKFKVLDGNDLFDVALVVLIYL